MFKRSKFVLIFSILSGLLFSSIGTFGSITNITGGFTDKLDYLAPIECGLVLVPEGPQKDRLKSLYRGTAGLHYRLSPNDRYTVIRILLGAGLHRLAVEHALRHLQDVASWNEQEIYYLAKTGRLRVVDTLSDPFEPDPDILEALGMKLVLAPGDEVFDGIRVESRLRNPRNLQLEINPKNHKVRKAIMELAESGALFRYLTGSLIYKVQVLLKDNKFIDLIHFRGQHFYAYGEISTKKVYRLEGYTGIRQVKSTNDGQEHWEPVWENTSEPLNIMAGLLFPEDALRDLREKAGRPFGTINNPAVELQEAGFHIDWENYNWK